MNNCSNCPFGDFEVVGKSCPAGRVKFCGPNKCGEKGWPACVRGSEYEKELELTKCEDGKGVFVNPN